MHVFVCLTSVFERGRPLPLLGFYILTTWEPAGIKITQRSSNFVIFLGLLLPTVVIFRVRPRWIVRGH